MAWMAWTMPTALFFTTIALILVAMTSWELALPSQERKGFLPIQTTRGDRLFIGLLSAAYINLGVLAATDWALWGALIVSIIWIGVLLRWG